MDGTAWKHSGGGFTPSKYFTAEADAAWQLNATRAYLDTSRSGVELPPSFMWDDEGRGLPDVSAIATDYSVVVNNASMPVSGTSASAPAVAGLVSRLNDARLRAGQPPMGHLNPWLYANPDIFRDVTTGKNDNGGLFGLPGFEAAAGWDPATGLGVPDAQKWLSAAMTAGKKAAANGELRAQRRGAAGGVPRAARATSWR